MYSPSWPGRRGQNTVQFEELASRGFIVAAVDHPFGSQQVALPGGRVARTTLGGFLSGDTVAEVRNSLRQVESEVAVRVADIRFVLDELERLDGNDPAGLFTGRLDIGRAGALGYSFGGAVAAEASSQDSRLKAVVNLDGMLFGRAAAGGIACPYLLVTGSLPEPAAGGPPVAPAATADEERDRILAADTAAEWRTLTTHGGSLLTVRGAVHLSLSAGAFHTPLRRGCGPLAAVPPSRVMRLLNDFTADFFSSTLVPSGPGPAAGPAVYPRPSSGRGPARSPVPSRPARPF
ncbi:MAG: hypothetical protein U0871_20710 [Gemmataceae bacterium]